MVTQVGVGYFTAFMIVIAYMLSYEFVEARKMEMVNNTDWVKNKGTVKTIKSEDGDVIDCVDIYKQPAFDHPLLKDHTLETSPSFYPKGSKSIISQAKIKQSWQKFGQCPQGTVPIRRSPKQDYRRAVPLNRYTKGLNGSIPNAAQPPHEYALATQSNSNFSGAQAKINVWSPATAINGVGFSTAQFWIISGRIDDGTLNTIEAGWQVSPPYYRNNKTRFFIYWTRDNYHSTGCYNLDCPGFVQTSKYFFIGGALSPVSSYGGQQYEIAITIYQDTVSKNWWLMVQGKVIGYWPGSIFTSLANFATDVSWGGEVVGRNSLGHHIANQMGSGHFPNEGFGKSSYFRNLGVMDQFGAMRDPENPEYSASNPLCYDIKVGSKSEDFGTNFYYGGPGYSDKCL